MGEVWVAEQREPIRRTVAVKVIKVGMDTRQVVARFEVERQALAVMDHPTIAKVLDAGATEHGRPYFVMEYVKGVPMTEYCDQQRLSTADRLELFMRVCEGVQHAHQKGIIHRDLKPSNVLVTIQDGRPVPKIIDFGIAKATAHRLTQHTMFTELGLLVGTPEYMSPEQAEMTALDIDTRTDIYSLGVLLYELLTGTLPFESRTLRQQALDEIRRIIRQVEPPRPSTRITQLGPASAETARNRLTDPVRLASQLRGDLDWITMKAIEKDRTRRYETATALAGDLQRHLQSEPVAAGPPSTAYRTMKFFRRHRFGVAVAAVIVLLILGTSVALAVQARRIADERDRANREAERANVEAVRAGRAADFLASLFRMADPAEARGRAVSAREVLDRGAARIGKELSNDALLQARLLFTMGDVYRSLGAIDRAEHLLGEAVDLRRRTLGAEAPDTLRTASLLGFVYDLGGKSDLAEKTLTSVLKAERRILGENHPDTLRTLNNLASVYDSQGRYDLYSTTIRQVFERRRHTLGEHHPDTLGSQYNFAIALYRENKFVEAEAMLKEVAASFTRIEGRDHPHTLMAKDLLATIYLGMQRPREARRVLAEVYEIRQRVLGSDHMDTLGSKVGLAKVARLEHRYQEAESLLRETLAAQERVLGPDHLDAIATRTSLAALFSDTRRDKEAEALWRETLSRMERTLGRDHPATAECFVGQAIVELHRGHTEAALDLIARAVHIDPLWRTRLADNTEFASLRDRPEFKALVSVSIRK
jgi:non-specific serine/threonine protein kinase/serine/threonine-protein kinase